MGVAKWNKPVPYLQVHAVHTHTGVHSCAVTSTIALMGGLHDKLIQCNNRTSSTPQAVSYPPLHHSALGSWLEVDPAAKEVVTVHAFIIQQQSHKSNMHRSMQSAHNTSKFTSFQSLVLPLSWALPLSPPPSEAQSRHSLPL